METDALFEEFSRMNNELVNARRELERLNMRLKEKEGFLKRILELTPDTVYVLEYPRGNPLFSNRIMEPFFDSGMEAEALDLWKRHLEALKTAADGDILDCEFQVSRSPGDQRWIMVRDTVFDRKPDGEPKRIVGVAEDVTDRKGRERALLSASLEDPLTGVLNRRGFMKSASLVLHEAALRVRSCTLLFMDLNGFKNINDLYGHQAGDDALRAAVALLRGSFRQSDIIARHGGDEFVVLLQDESDGALQALLGRFRGEIERYNDDSGAPWRISFAIGTAIWKPDSEESLDDLLRRADIAMYASKRSERRV